jgi:hypothetical protein
VRANLLHEESPSSAAIAICSALQTVPHDLDSEREFSCRIEAISLGSAFYTPGPDLY